MDALRQWLRRAGLESLADKLHEHNIDLEILDDLDEAALEKIGLSLGHRRKLLRAVKNSPPPPPELPTRSHPERRQLTVLFCDLVDSTRIAVRVDPEELRELMNEYWDICEACVRGHGGYVARHMGDGLLNYFGYPASDEHSVEQAIKAGLAIVEELSRVRRKLTGRMRVRVGIATGEVVVGDIVEADYAREITAHGEAPNLAARLQSLAAPNTVIIADRTRQLAGDLFDYDEPEQHDLKGYEQPVTVWKVRGESEFVSRFDARNAADARQRLVGRAAELGLLKDHLAHAVSGSGTIVLLEGEAGIGKSRLVRALAEENVGARLLQLSGSPHMRNAAWHPIKQAFAQTAGLSRQDPDLVWRTRLARVLSGLGSDDAERLQSLAFLLGLETAEQTAPVSPEYRKELALVAIEELFVKASTAPVLVVVEDLHWVDPTTIELVNRIGRKIDKLPVCLVLTSRPDADTLDKLQCSPVRIRLGSLSSAAIDTLIRDTPESSSIPDEFVGVINKKSGGIPLFARELTKAVIDNLRRGESPEAMESEVAVPATLQDSLLSRLGHNDDVKRVAQLAAIVGREFRSELLTAVSEDDERLLQASVSELVELNILQDSSGGTGDSYTFTHALLHDAIYACVLHSDLQAAHKTVAESLVRRFPQVAESEPHIVAFHFSAGLQPEPAVAYWCQAAEISASRAAHAEALTYLEKCYAELPGVSEANVRDALELKILVGRALSLTSTLGYADPTVADTYNRARLLCSRGEDSSLMFPIVLGLWRFYVVRDELDTALELAHQCLSIAHETGDRNFRIEAYTAVAFTIFVQGRFDLAKEHLEKAIALYRSLRPGEFVQHSTQDPEIACLSLLAVIEAHLGFPDRAATTTADALARARTMNDPGTLVFALHYSAVLYQLLGEPDTARHHAQEALTLCMELGLVGLEVLSRLHLAIADGTGEDATDTSGVLGELLDTWQAMGGEAYRPYFLAFKAFIHIQHKDFEVGLSTIESALQHAATRGSSFCDGLLNCALAELYLTGPKADRARASTFLRRALKACTSSSSRWVELRALNLQAKIDGAENHQNALTQMLDSIEGGSELPLTLETRKLLSQSS